MADTKLASRRTPFPQGTKMAFVQAAPPVDWVQDTTNDRFLRVVNTAGGGLAGPINTALTFTNPPHPDHTVPSHNHDLNGHTHTVSHDHGTPSRTNGMSATPNLGNESAGVVYGIRDDVAGLTTRTTHHIRTNNANTDEGHHDHLFTSRVNVTSFASGTPQPTATSLVGDTTFGISASLDHAHLINTLFRPRYKNIIFAIMGG